MIGVLLIMAAMACSALWVGLQMFGHGPARAWFRVWTAAALVLAVAGIILLRMGI